MNNEYPSACDFIAELDHLKQSFESRFKECDDMKLCLRFVRDKISFDPDEFNNIFVDDVAAAQTELLELKSNFEIRDFHDKLSLDLFWKRLTTGLRCFIGVVCYISHHLLNLVIALYQVFSGICTTRPVCLASSFSH